MRFKLRYHDDGDDDDDEDEDDEDEDDEDEDDVVVVRVGRINIKIRPIANRDPPVLDPALYDIKYIKIEELVAQGFDIDAPCRHRPPYNPGGWDDS